MHVAFVLSLFVLRLNFQSCSFLLYAHDECDATYSGVAAWRLKSRTDHVDSLLALNDKSKKHNSSLLALKEKSYKQNSSLLALYDKSKKHNISLLALDDKISEHNDALLGLDSKSNGPDKSLVELDGSATHELQLSLSLDLNGYMVWILIVAAAFTLLCLILVICFHGGVQRSEKLEQETAMHARTYSNAAPSNFQAKTCETVAQENTTDFSSIDVQSGSSSLPSKSGARDGGGDDRNIGASDNPHAKTDEAVVQGSAARVSSRLDESSGSSSLPSKSGARDGGGDDRNIGASDNPHAKTDEAVVQGSAARVSSRLDESSGSSSLPSKSGARDGGGDDRNIGASDNPHAKTDEAVVQGSAARVSSRLDESSGSSSLSSKSGARDSGGDDRNSGASGNPHAKTDEAVDHGSAALVSSRMDVPSGSTSALNEDGRSDGSVERFSRGSSDSSDDSEVRRSVTRMANTKIWRGSLQVPPTQRLVPDTERRDSAESDIF
eukprot:TRINITY_DN2291_c0_g1_i3.p1 TRINITY_DN2291_c0_g1~~TRINITY_DN2291_c0_g1_i3.p1  ORF type:complete len:494 (-),score=50.55 TRINITY_DN2291_c0_g1_i3:379-1860(-)